MAAGGGNLGDRPADAPAQRRIVLLGASNLTRALPVVLDHARDAWGAPLDVLAALGHGRSYGQESCVLGRSLPGILTCGLWPALAARPPGSVAALLTDVGNDIIYGVPPATILQWIAECLARLAELKARVVVTLLPTVNISALSAWRYRFLRTCFFPGCRLSLAEALERAALIQTGLEELAAQFAVQTVRPRETWYGFDPIHISRRVWPEAWSEIFAPWMNNAQSAPRSRSRAPHALYWNSLWPEQQRWFGIRQRFAQPCGTLRDGTTIALY